MAPGGDTFKVTQAARAGSTFVPGVQDPERDAPLVSETRAIGRVVAVTPCGFGTQAVESSAARCAAATTTLTAAKPTRQAHNEDNLLTGKQLSDSGSSTCPPLLYN
jgi:hypothetical protein